ncbi:MAG: poly-gamma-glutamate synthase PgsB [Tissierellaceae bacterium]|nr:poly-gamma-glutamate synthase PgsB [Tissierellaceae bacterium]
MEKILFIISGIFILYLAAESYNAARYRRAIKNVIYVNGTRGKSSVTRLIDAGLRAGGYRTYAKTTGTLPMVIDTNGNEKLIHRRGRANIKEQINILKEAAKEKSEVLVIECMAVHPELQYISQHRMVKSNIGVITNVRPDHLDVMGNTLKEIGQSLCNTIPKNGTSFTADQDFFIDFKSRSEKIGAKPYLILPKGDEPEFDFSENIALALAVCEHLGVKREVALKGMKNYKRDPYALSIYILSNGAIFIGGLSINDPVSTQLVYERMIKKLDLENHNLTLFISNRLDRGYRTLQHRDLAEKLDPQAIWITGGNSRVIARFLSKRLSKCPVTIFKNTMDAPLQDLNANDVVFAIGNIAEGGNTIMERVKKEGTPYV